MEFIHQSFLHFERMWAVSLRHVRQMYKDTSRLIHIFYWPFLDFVLWGFTAKWMQSSYVHDSRLAITMLTALVAWQMAVRANLDVSTHLLEDVQDANIPNLFCSPLSIYEWAGGIFLLSCVNVAALFVFSCASIALLYQMNVIAVGWPLLPYLISLFISGLGIGFFAASLIIYYGRRVIGLIYMIGWLFAPFSGAFYAISVLPTAMRVVAYCLPMSYAIEGVRQLVMTSTFSWYLFAMSFVLSCVLFVMAFVFFLYMFAASKSKGLSRLSD
jgi:ABC-2 type transport system permease protein